MRYDYTSADGTFTAKLNFQNGVSISFLTPTNDHRWYLDFSAPNGDMLGVETYIGATRFPFQDSGDPGLDISGDGSGCNELTGSFEVKEVVYGAGGEIIAFCATFEQHCEGITPALRGEIRFNSSMVDPPYAPRTLMVPSEYSTIQAAINAAADGDTVLVSAGTYLENIDFWGKFITVKSETGPEVTIIDGNDADTVTTFISGERQSSVLSGFTLRNGRSGYDTPGFGDGGGIRIWSSSPTILNNVIRNNKCCNGCGISITYGAPLIQGNSIVSNTGGGCGGVGGMGISLLYNSPAQIIGNVISENSGSEAGGGISLFSAGMPVIMGNSIDRKNFFCRRRDTYRQFF